VQGFLDPENYPDITIDSSSAPSITKEMNEKIMSELMQIEEKIESLRSANSDIENADLSS
jgi:tetrahydromethanopterin S-methyltransferase subunit B